MAGWLDVTSVLLEYLLISDRTATFRPRWRPHCTSIVTRNMGIMDMEIKSKSRNSLSYPEITFFLRQNPKVHNNTGTYRQGTPRHESEHGLYF
jgi:hypothetical protein